MFFRCHGASAILSFPISAKEGLAMITPIALGRRLAVPGTMPG